MPERGQDKQTFLAIVVILAITMLWIYFSPKSTPPPQPKPQATADKLKDMAKSEPKEVPKRKVEPIRALKNIPETLKTFETKLYTVVFSSKNAAIKSLKLKNFRKTIAKDSPLVDIFDFGKVGKDPIRWLFEIDGLAYSTDVPFEIVQAKEMGISFKAILSSVDKKRDPVELVVSYGMNDENYTIEYALTLKNSSDKEIKAGGTMKLYGLNPEVKKPSLGFMTPGEEPVKAVYDFNDKISRDILPKQIMMKDVLQGDIKWLGFNDKYFMSAAIPKSPSVWSFRFDDERDQVSFFSGDDEAGSARVVKVQGTLTELTSVPNNVSTLDYKIERDSSVIAEGSSPSVIEQASGCYGKKQLLVLDIPKDVTLVDNLFSARINYPERKIKAGEKAEYLSQIYAGPKDINILKKMGNSMDRAIDLGDWLGVIARPLLYFLKWLYSVIPNYGIAIILLTIVVRLLMYPLGQMQAKSMRAMQTLKPEMDKLREKYGKDKEALNREMMKLWKIHKVNPMSGCLPLILQLPIFFALYRVLYNSIELRHAPFFLWIKDLSEYDPYFVMPILMGASFFLQSKMTPQAGGDPAQQKMFMYVFPVMFTVLMATLPSGLNLYIFVSTVLGLLQQFYAMKGTKVKTA